MPDASVTNKKCLWPCRQIANTPMDTDKIKVFGSRVKVDSVAKVAELELAEKEKMKEKVRFYSGFYERM